jgi:hypothetical protein
MHKRQDLVIGVDFDNTLIIYDELFRRLAEERGLIDGRTAQGKTEIRDAIRRLPDGEIHWQRLQAAAYGPRIGEARLADGAGEFLDECWRAGAKVYVVSHKTELAGYDETNTNLRHAAVEWMRGTGLFRPGGLAPEAVRFGSTRAEKIDHIRNLGCTHFIDDLEEVFREESFPAEAERILYSPHSRGQSWPGVHVARSWKQIRECLFGTGD